MSYGRRTLRRYCGVARKPYQRQDKRYTNPTLMMSLSGGEHRAEDWSLGGFRLGGFYLSAPLGLRVAGAILRPDGRDGGAFVGELIGRSDSFGGARFRFQSLSDDAFNQLQSMILSSRG